jgi:opacity protein-like surface antigen
MKKLFLIVATVSLATGVYAQNKFGLKAGLNLSQESSGSIKLDGTTLSESDASSILPGFHVGIYGNFGFNDHLGLQLEGVFSMQGGSESEDAVTLKEHFNYINIPILLDIKPIPAFSIFVGPQIGFNIYNSIKAGEESISGSDVDDLFEEMGCKVNVIDFAAVVGLQYTVMEHFTIGARYNIGFTSILGPTSEAKDAKLSVSGIANRVIQFSVGWTF